VTAWPVTAHACATRASVNQILDRRQREGNRIDVDRIMLRIGLTRAVPRGGAAAESRRH